MEGYEGESATLSCPGATPGTSGDYTFNWYKGRYEAKDKLENRVAVYDVFNGQTTGPLYQGDLAPPRSASLDTSTGDLTINQLQLSSISDDSWYTCLSTSPIHYRGIVKLNVNGG